VNCEPLILGDEVTAIFLICLELGGAALGGA